MVERVLEIEKFPFGNHHSGVRFRQELSIDVKAGGQRFSEDHDIGIIS